tara:strand:- start:131 stop:310 length:180 start_codon:yes stop_codon:yes gene_type:complete
MKTLKVDMDLLEIQLEELSNEVGYRAKNGEDADALEGVYNMLADIVNTMKQAGQCRLER